MSNRTCPECGTIFDGHGRRKFCADLCNYRAKERRRVEAGYYQQPHVAKRVASAKRAGYRRGIEAGKNSGRLLAIWSAHGVDGANQMPSECVIDECSRATFARLKCKPHYEREMRLAGKSWAEYNEIAGDDYRKRAEKFGVPFERFGKLDIFIRDSWMCGICLEPVDPELLYPDPMSVSLDHVIPLSRGGGHLESNTQCSHLSCNVRKGARDATSAEAGAFAGTAWIS